MGCSLPMDPYAWPMLLNGHIYLNICFQVTIILNVRLSTI